jgi:WD repeat-containing protein 7
MEQVEAPKNYVDFEEEEDKLKHMLKGRPLKDKATLEKLSTRSTKSIGGNEATLLPPSEIEPAANREATSNSLLSATNSPAFTPRSLSWSTSPNSGTSISKDPRGGSQYFTLRCHVIPPRSGDGCSITGMQLLGQDSLFAVLQETG